MATILSGQERTLRLRNAANMLVAAARQSRAIQREADAMLDQGYDPTDISTAINALLVDLSAQVSQVITQLGLINYTYQERVRIGNPHEFDFAVVEAVADALSPGGTIRVNDARESYLNPFKVFAANDTVTLVDATAPENKGQSFRVRFAIPDSGPNILTNPDFSSDWTTTNWTISSGEATHNTGNTSPLSQAYANMDYLQTGMFIASFTVSGRTAGTVDVQWATTGPVRTIGADGEFEAIVEMSASDAFTFTPTSDFDGTISEPVLVPFTGLAFTGGLNANSDPETKLDIVLSER